MSSDTLQHRMTEFKTVTVVPLSGANYATWKIQCQMALMRDGVWKIVDGTEKSPTTGGADAQVKFDSRRDRALAIIVLSIEPTLLYLLGNPKDPSEVWKTLADQFQKKTWTNRLSLRRKLHSLKLKDGVSVQSHIKEMTEIFNELAIVGDAIGDSNRVVYLLASLPESYDMLVTAFEAHEAVPDMQVVTERLLHEERKLQDCGSSSSNPASGGALTARHNFKKGPRCHFCKKFGHIQRNCRERERSQQSGASEKHIKKPQHKAHSAETRQRVESDEAGLVVNHVLSADGKPRLTGRWIIDSGATSHTCNDRDLFIGLYPLKSPLEVLLGDGHKLTATAYGTVKLLMKSGQRSSRKCILHDVLYIPELSYNLLSVSKAVERGNIVKFGSSSCIIRDSNRKLITIAQNVGGLYQIDTTATYINSAQTTSCREITKEDVWHRRFGHLNFKELTKISQR